MKLLLLVLLLLILSISSLRGLVYLTVPTLIICYGQYGDNWFRSEVPDGRWNSITSDSTGQFLAAVQIYGNIFTSSSGYYSYIILFSLLSLLLLLLSLLLFLLL